MKSETTMTSARRRASLATVSQHRRQVGRAAAGQGRLGPPGCVPAPPARGRRLRCSPPCWPPGPGFPAGRARRRCAAPGRARSPAAPSAPRRCRTAGRRPGCRPAEHPGQHHGQLAQHVVLAPPGHAHRHGRQQVEHQPRGQLAVLVEHPDLRLGQPGGDVPVDVPGVVAGQVLAEAQVDARSR